MLRLLSLVAAVLFLAAGMALDCTSVSAQNWVDIPGRIGFIADNGQVKSLHFSSWTSNKETFVPNARGNEILLAGFFSYAHEDKHVVAHVTDYESYTLHGVGNPIEITFKDKSAAEVEVTNSFIWAIARMNTFRFMSRDKRLGRDVLYEVPAASVKRLFFYGERPSLDQKAQTHTEWNSVR